MKYCWSKFNLFFILASTRDLNHWYKNKMSCLYTSLCCPKTPCFYFAGKGHELSSPLQSSYCSPWFKIVEFVGWQELDCKGNAEIQFLQSPCFLCMTLFSAINTMIHSSRACSRKRCWNSIFPITLLIYVVQSGRWLWSFTSETWNISANKNWKRNSKCEQNLLDEYGRYSPEEWDCHKHWSTTFSAYPLKIW